MTDVVLKFTDQDITISDAFTGPGTSVGEFILDQLDSDLKAAESDVQGCIYYAEFDRIDCHIDEAHSGGVETTLAAVISNHEPDAPISPFSGTALGITSGPSTGSQTFVTLPDMTFTGDFSGNEVHIDFRGTFSLSSTLLGSDEVEVSLFLDGSEVSTSYRATARVSGVAMTAIKNADIHANIPVPAGNHTIEIRWRRQGTQATVTAYQTQRSFRVQEKGF